MQGRSEHVVATRAVVAYDVLTAVAKERLCVVVHSDVRHLTLTFRLGGGESSDLLVLATVLDTGHGLSKLVLNGRDDRDGSTIDLADFSESFFADVERGLRSESGDEGRSRLVSGCFGATASGDGDRPWDAGERGAHVYCLTPSVLP
jgi:hypothetical protein